jgi:hypothetical protein
MLARKIDAAADHGIDAVIFYWNHYDGSSLERPLGRGLLGALNNLRRFSRACAEIRV